MADEADVRRIALSLPDTVEVVDRFGFSVLDKGFPAVLIRLAAIDVDELEELIVDAWRCQAPRAVVKEFDERFS